MRADTVWLQPARFDKGDAGGGRGVAPGRRRGSSFGTRSGRRSGSSIGCSTRRSRSRLTQLLLVHLPAGAGAADADRRFRRALRRAAGRGRLLAERGHRLRDPRGLRDSRRLRGRARARAPPPDGAGRLARHRRRRLRQRGDDPGGGPGALAPRRDLPRHEDGAGGRGDDAVLRRRLVPRADAPGRGRRDEAALVVRLRPDAQERQRRRVELDQGGDAARPPGLRDRAGDRPRLLRSAPDRSALHDDRRHRARRRRARPAVHPRLANPPAQPEPDGDRAAVGDRRGRAGRQRQVAVRGRAGGGALGGGLAGVAAARRRLSSADSTFRGLAPEAEAALYYERYFDFAARRRGAVAPGVAARAPTAR